MVRTFTRKSDMSPGLRDTGDFIAGEDINELQLAVEDIQTGTLPVALAGIADALGEYAPLVWDSERTIDPRKNGATGTGSHDDTQAFQDSVDEAIEKQAALVIPDPPSGGHWSIRDTITAWPSVNNQTILRMNAHTHYPDILWEGGNGKAIFDLRNVKRSVIENIGVRIEDTVDGVTVWDIVCDVTYTSSSPVIFRNCQANLINATCSNGWRTQATGGVADISMIEWDTCIVSSTHLSGGQGNIGWLNTNSNGLVYNWLNSGAFDVHTQFSNHPRFALLDGGIDASQTTIPVTDGRLFPLSGGRFKLDDEWIDYTARSSNNLTGCTRGANGSTAATHLTLHLLTLDTTAAGGSAMAFFGCLGGYNQVDFQLARDGVHTIHGGRWELGKRFMQTGVWGTPLVTVDVVGAKIADYTPSDGIVFGLGFNTALSLKSFSATGTGYDANFISADSFDGAAGGARGYKAGLALDNVSIQGSASTYWTLTADYELDIRNSFELDSSRRATAVLAP